MLERRGCSAVLFYIQQKTESLQVLDCWTKQDIWGRHLRLWESKMEKIMWRWIKNDNIIMLRHVDEIPEQSRSDSKLCLTADDFKLFFSLSLKLHPWLCKSSLTLCLRCFQPQIRPAVVMWLTNKLHQLRKAIRCGWKLQKHRVNTDDFHKMLTDPVSAVISLNLQSSVWRRAVAPSAVNQREQQSHCSSFTDMKLDSNMQGILYKVYRSIFEDNYCLYYYYYYDYYSTLSTNCN